MGGQGGQGGPGGPEGFASPRRAGAGGGLGAEAGEPAGAGLQAGHRTPVQDSTRSYFFIEMDTSYRLINI